MIVYIASIIPVENLFKGDLLDIFILTSFVDVKKKQVLHGFISLQSDGLISVGDMCYSFMTVVALLKLK